MSTVLDRCPAVRGPRRRRDVTLPRLGCDLGVPLGDVVAVAEQLRDEGRWDFDDQALQGGVAGSEQIDAQGANRNMMDCGSRWRPGRLLGNIHGVAATPPVVRRLGRVRMWVFSMSANGFGTGIGSCPSEMRVSPSVEVTAAVGKAAILVRGWAYKSGRIPATR